MNGINTGKVVIVCYHQRPLRDCNDDLNTFWQSVLLGQKKSFLERFRAFLGGEL